MLIRSAGIDVRDRKLLDTEGRAYTLGSLIAEGGQGRVYAEESGALAIKLLNGPSPGIGQMLANVTRLPLGDLRIALPFAVLHHRPGYVMELIPDLEAWDRLVPRSDPTGLSNSWLEAGGLRRRYELCADLSRTMAKLAERGLVYGDLSLANVLVTRVSDAAAQAWLIDADNLSYGSTSPVYTPPYAAPELFRQEAHACSTYTDAWSLAAMTFETLTGTHPLIGDAVQDAPPLVEQQALAGLMPWIDDSDDRSNSCTAGLDRDVVLTKQLRDLFAAMFGPGRMDPLRRPSISDIADAFDQASDLIVDCQACGTGNLARRDQRCLYCGVALRGIRLLRVISEPLTRAEREAIKVALEGVADDRKPILSPRGAWFALEEGRELTLAGSRVAYGAGDLIAATIKLVGTDVFVTPRSEIPVFILERKKWIPVPLAGLSVRGDLNLRFGVEDAPHRYLREYPARR